MARHFTHDKPTKPGIYWLKETKYHGEKCLKIEDRDGELIVSDDNENSVYYRNMFIQNFVITCLWSPAIIELSAMKIEVEKLLSLLNDPQGMFTWTDFVQERLENLSRMRMLPIDYS